MSGFFQTIIHGVISFLMIGVVAVTGIMPGHHKITITPTPTSHLAKTATPSATITPKTQVKGIKTTRFLTPTTSYVQTIFSPTQIPSTPNTRQTYGILALSQLVNMNGANAQSVQAAYDAYSTFLQTPNLEYMTPAHQQQVFTPILTVAVQKIVDQQKAQLQQQVYSLNQQLSSTPPTPTQYYQSNSTQNSSLQTCITNKIATINSNPYLSESQREAEVANAPQACANQQ